MIILAINKNQYGLKNIDTQLSIGLIAEIRLLFEMSGSMVTTFQSIAEYDPELRISNNSGCSFFTYHVFFIFYFHMSFAEYTLLIIESTIKNADQFLKQLAFHLLNEIINCICKYEVTFVSRMSM